MKRVVVTFVLAVASLITGLPCTAKADCCRGRGPMRRMMGMMVAVGTMGMVTPNRRATSSAVTTNIPAPPADATPTPAPGGST
jgi:hypothetical protein